MRLKKGITPKQTDTNYFHTDLFDPQLKPKYVLPLRVWVGLRVGVIPHFPEFQNWPLIIGCSLESYS